MTTLMEKEGQRQEVPDDQVQDYLLGGWTPVDGRVPATVAFQDPRTGEQRVRNMYVEAERWQEAAQAAADRGASLLRRTPELEIIRQEQRRAEGEQQYAENVGIGQQFAFSTLDRLAFGGISALTREVDPARGTQLTQGQDILARQNPGVDLAAQLASIGIPLLMGGAGFARAFAGPTGLAMETGQLARAGIGGAAGRMAGGVIEGGLDLALQEAVNANIRNDYEGLSERMLSSGALGALFGGAIEGGGILYREARAARQARAQAIGEVTAEQLASQPRGILNRIWDRAQELLSGNDPSRFRVSRMGNVPVTDDVAVAGWRRVSPQPGEVVARLADDASEGISAYRQAARDLRDARWVQNPVVRQAWDAAPNANMAAQAVGTTAAEAQQFIRANNLSGAVVTYATDLAAAARSGNVEQMLAIREQLKSLQGKGGNLGTVTNDLAVGIDQALANAGGDFGALFKRRQDFLSAVDEMELFIGKALDVQGGINRIQPFVLEKALNNFARGGNKQALEALETTLDPTLLREAEQVFGLKGIRSLPDDLLARARRDIADWEAYSQFRNLELNVNSASGFASALGVGGGSILAFGAMNDDPSAIGIGAAGLAGAFLSKPTGAARFMNTLRNLFRSQESRIQSGTSNMQAAMRGQPLQTSRIAPVTAAGKALLSEDRREREQTYERMASRVEELLANPDSFYTAFLPQVEGADRINPQLGMQMGMDAQRSLQVLAENIPLSRRARRNLPQLPGITIPPSDSEMDEFLEAAAVIEDPILSLDLFAAGRLSNTGARALQRAFPGFYRGVTQAAFQEYARMTQEGSLPDFQALSQMSVLLGTPLDPSLDPSMILTFQSNYSQTAEQERAVRSPDTVRREVNNLYASNNETMSQGLQ